MLYLFISVIIYVLQTHIHTHRHTHKATLNHVTILLPAAAELWENTDFMMLLQPLILQPNSVLSFHTHTHTQTHTLGCMEAVAR